MDYLKRTLNELRESAGFNQAELANILEVSPKTLWLYEQDSTNIPDELIKKYMYFLMFLMRIYFSDLSTKNSYL
ncbi:helix-turn-helix domain-containing protein [Bacillus cereus]|uniref:helix-turn-helix domain-containing protein n=1 Tax=Bacillus cereus TaxID=1396 RepID=UPI0020D27D74|nr:helix-turn-helix transcriptional regulator [Bacillus cereus]